MDSSATYISFIVRYVTVICCGEVSEFLLWLCFIVDCFDKLTVLRVFSVAFLSIALAVGLLEWTCEIWHVFGLHAGRV